MNPKRMIVIVGAGLSGATLAERFANDGHKVTIFEKRDHVGGNTYDEINEYGIRVAKYGAHIFHTNDKEVWNYINQFSKWIPYQHRVLSRVNGKHVPVPVNISTVNQLFNADITTVQGMIRWLKTRTLKIKTPKNSEEAALKLVGNDLYELMFKNYTKKQWDKYPSELEASVLERIPVRTNWEDRYFTDDFQGLPAAGYTRMVEKMLSNPLIKINLKADFEKFKHVYNGVHIYYTGKIDAYYNEKFGKLEYRSLRFEHQTLENSQKDFQPAAVVNYPMSKYPWTRIIEHRQFYGGSGPFTTITKEYSVDYKEGENEPYYPVPTEANREIYKLYKKEANRKRHVTFVGRLANYKYFNMDQAIRNALDVYEQTKGNK